MVEEVLQNERVRTTSQFTSIAAVNYACQAPPAVPRTDTDQRLSCSSRPKLTLMRLSGPLLATFMLDTGAREELCSSLTHKLRFVREHPCISNRATTY